MRTYKINLKINNEVVLTHEIDMYKVTYKKWIEIMGKMKESLNRNKEINQSVSLESEINFTINKQDFKNLNEIYLNNEQFFTVFSKIIFRMKNDFTENEEIRIHEECSPVVERINKSLKRMAKYNEIIERNESTVNVYSIKSQNKHLSMRRNLEFISKLKDMGEKTKIYSLSELADMIEFDKTHSSLRYVLDLAGIEYKKYR